MSRAQLSNRQILADEFGQNYEIVEDAEVDGIVYAAVKNLHTGNVTATINVIHPGGKTNGWDEWENPAFDSAPASVLDALTDDPYASAKWRERCRKNIAKS